MGGVRDGGRRGARTGARVGAGVGARDGGRVGARGGGRGGARGGVEDCGRRVVAVLDRALGTENDFVSGAIFSSTVQSIAYKKEVCGING